MLSAKARFDQLPPEQQQVLRDLHDKLKAIPPSGPRTDGRHSARHEAYGYKLANVLKTIRIKGASDGRAAALKAGLGAHADVRKALRLAEARAH